MNRLKNEKSPYLQQHANQPVDWQPWDTAALAQAKSENKPILLSIGYAANHTCHVMARESFSNNKVAQLMNQHFVCIKVDREERPDLDRIYQKANHMLNQGSGGWPLTMFLDPNDHIPIFGGTYFPPQQSRSTPGFRDVLRGIADAYGTQTERMEEFKRNMLEALSSATHDSGELAMDPVLIDRACGQIDSSFDEEHGGFNESPKLAHAPGLAMMLDVAHTIDEQQKIDRLLHMLDFTLVGMSRGGLYDHVGGGFHSHAVDADWTIPRFEKMLFDNALLLPLFAQRAQQTDGAWFGEVANRTADWMLSELQLDEGGFGASLDADLKGDEGRYYVWLKEEVKAIVGDDYNIFVEKFGMENRPNFANNYHLRLPLPDPKGEDWQDNPMAEIADARTKLLEARANRGSPPRDEKIITSWNALAIRGLVQAGKYLERDDCIDAAVRTLDHLVQANWNDGTLFASSLNGETMRTAYLDDYAHLINAILAVLSVRWRAADVQLAITLADALITQFEDSETGGFYFTSHDHETLIQRTKPFADDSLPSGNGSAIRALLELGHLLGEQRYTDTAERALKAAMGEVEQWPSAHATVIRGLQNWSSPPVRVVIRAPDGTDVTDWRAAAEKAFSSRVRCYVVPSNETGLPGALGDCVSEDNVVAYVNRGGSYGTAVSAYSNLGADS